MKDGVVGRIDDAVAVVVARQATDNRPYAQDARIDVPGPVKTARQIQQVKIAADRTEVKNIKRMPIEGRETVDQRHSQCPCQVSLSADHQAIVLVTRGGTCNFNCQCTARSLGVIAIDRQRARAVTRRYGPFHIFQISDDHPRAGNRTAGPNNTPPSGHHRIVDAQLATAVLNKVMTV